MEFIELVEKLEKHFGEEAIFHQYDESTRTFTPVSWKNHKNEKYNVTVAGYYAYEYGEMILKYNMQKTKSDQVLKWEQGYYGFSHRCGQTFSIGDKLFDENWVIDDTHPEYLKFKKLANEKGGDIMDYVPFTQRGSITITTDEQAFQSALNFARYVS